MKKKLISSFVTVFMIGALNVSAATYNDLTYEISNGVATITDCNEYATYVVIPDTLEGYPVTSIGDMAFAECKSLAGVIIPGTVVSIGDGAFTLCESLKDVCLPAGVTSIGKYAFAECTGLESINLPYGITSIGEGTFAACENLTGIGIPQSVTSIGDWAFYKSSKLTDIYVGNRITNIGFNAFEETAYYNNPLNWNNGVLYVGNCLVKAEYDIADGGCIKYNTPVIADSAFSFCENLTDITIPNSVTNICEYAFSACNGLETVYYGGTPSQWNTINIGIENQSLNDSYMVYGYYYR